jgi:hypothetical protein
MSCSQYYLPVQDENLHHTNNFSIRESNNIIYGISLKNRYYVPEEISDNYFPIFITINNQSNHNFNISRNDVIILDENNNQYDSVSNDELINLLSDLFSQRTVIDKFDIGNLDRKNEILQKNIEGKNTIIKYSFRFGFIAPGAKKSGFVFFPEIPYKNKKITIIVKNQKFIYIKHKK